DAAAAGPVQPTPDPTRRPRRRNRRPGTADRPGEPAPDTAGQPRGRDRRDAREARGGREDRPRDGRGGREGRSRDGRARGRDDRPKKVERKLYAFDSVVDRGFEDVEEESGTRRVHWTIVKRTVADQISRKPMAQNYVLQRDGADSEFPSLGAARDAVNKKIVHPEKLTLSKAEHAAQKSGR
ncbi:MAG TPA: hypothetical protein VG651_11670, partial [Stellaceae bacterium]|nr:hypothetical protein [Stellaceae bacterium]